MDAYLCKVAKGVSATPFKNSEEQVNGQSKLENEPPLKKLKQDTFGDANNCNEIIIIDAEVATAEDKDETKDSCDAPVVEQSSDKNGCTTQNMENADEKDDKLNHDKTPPKNDDISPPKQKRRKLTNEEKKAQMKQKEEARILKEKMLLEKQLEKEKKEKEKELLRQKREKERQEKQAKKEQLEKERLEKQKKREEIMHAKEEERKKKEEERKQKEEEKKKLEQEKRLKDEEELRKKERAKSAFKSFFIKKSPPKKIATVGEECKRFAPFELKPNMTLAPICRGKKVEDKSRFDEQCEPQSASELYLSLLRSRCSTEGLKYITKRDLKQKKNSTNENKDADEDVIVIGSTDSPCKDPPEHQTMRVKLLQFSENYRPGYYGTWRKRSMFISPRNPFKKDEDHFNYEIDSDEEWEEEEPGESLSGPENDDEEEEDNDDDEDDDGFFVPHGYLSDDEGIDGESDGEKEEERVDIKDRKLDKTEGFPFDKKGKAKQQKAVCFGSSWFSSPNDVPSFLTEFKISSMVSVPIDVFELRPKEKSEEKKSPTQNTESIPGNVYRGSIPMRVPEDAMHLLINHVHKNSFGLNKLIITFLDFWKSRQPKEEAAAAAYPQISKRQLERKILEIAKRETIPESNKSCYIVHQHILEKYAAQLETCKDDTLTHKISSPKTPSHIVKANEACNGIASSDGGNTHDKTSILNNSVKNQGCSVLHNGDNLPSNTSKSETPLEAEMIVI